MGTADSIVVADLPEPTGRFFDSVTGELLGSTPDGPYITALLAADAGWHVGVTYPPFDLEVVDLRTTEVIYSISVSEPLRFASPPAGDHLLAFGVSTGESIRFDTATWEQSASGIPAGEAVLGEFSQDGRWLVTVDRSGSMAVHDAATLEIIHRLADTGVGNFPQPLAFSDDGRYLVSALDESLRLWDVELGVQIGAEIPSRARAAPGRSEAPRSVERRSPTSSSSCGRSTSTAGRSSPADWRAAT